MAVFIPKHRLGSGSPTSQGSSGSRGPRGPMRIKAQHPQQITNTIENLPGFQALKESYAEAKAERAKELKDKYESNADVQRWRTQLSPEQRTRDAIERMVPTTRAVEEMRRGGKEVSYEDARKKAEEIAYKSDKQKAEG